MTRNNIRHTVKVVSYEKGYGCALHFVEDLTYRDALREMKRQQKRYKDNDNVCIHILFVNESNGNNGFLNGTLYEDTPKNWNDNL